mgnify:CR=1 FL=1
MAYIGQKPGSNFRGVTFKDSFTGDGSTVAFDLTLQPIENSNFVLI